jgi:hypothetical protein
MQSCDCRSALMQRLDFISSVSGRRQSLPVRRFRALHRVVAHRKNGPRLRTSNRHQTGETAPDSPAPLSRAAGRNKRAEKLQAVVDCRAVSRTADSRCKLANPSKPPVAKCGWFVLQARKSIVKPTRMLLFRRLPEGACCRTLELNLVLFGRNARFEGRKILYQHLATRASNRSPLRILSKLDQTAIGIRMRSNVVGTLRVAYWPTALGERLQF